MTNLIVSSQSQAVATREQVGQYLTFLVDGENFAISILEVKEIIEIANVTHVPLTPAFIHGVINLRGNVVPVVDLSARLKQHAAQINRRSCIVLIELNMADGDHQLIGMLVDEVREILEIPPANIQPAPDFGSSIRTDFIQSMARVNDQFIILIEIDKVLSLDELSQTNTLQ